MKTIDNVYAQHAEKPFILPKYEEELLTKPIAKRQMERTAEGLLPGHIIMLWRIQFGTYLTSSSHHKYFYTTYGIDAEKELRFLIEQGYVKVDSAVESLKHLAAPKLKAFLKAKGVSGLSKMKRSDLDEAMLAVYTEEELSQLFQLRSYAITQKGRTILEKYPEIIAKHPQKKF
ncbi:hypothetical protein [Streptococcus dentiloxodontae]